MPIESENVNESIQLAIDNAISRLHLLEGRNRWAIVNEYKEWIADATIKEEIWSMKYLKCEAND